ncbi:MAGE-like protein 2 isoform X1 [Amborella trichopoda]|uniref:MAGE-like protein 2 isoform X1 n=1 Tax=Amborella trichopoda TaxID=13333 RepID=UPI0005D2F3AE|nr:MAGE-like protein 2 isoform X1 [Amborella trichopoda]XP_020528259.1 MAGE-like protein 2 isoform X1 [Amborella trichopoda]XP_020528260.1 MAGE-like protein 2 isoform X1 [Amborella trichopoda]XP_020528261.1 MAGE-like protein 2 isoform X1 [Amborella trichopoda]XP_020528262.1 MAGE-like protein 2 isoform X1 [Amborella trichopoda]|eukprot:XP_011626532.1 MAGE-like protein 2 isoform X1 [Amborella trichopoda]
METADADYLSQIDVSIEEKDKLVSEVIRYVLFKNHQNSGAPIKREELAQLITKNYRQRQLPSLVINEARMKLNSIFGYELRELQRLRSSSNNKGCGSRQAADAKSYVLISKLPSEIYSKYVENKETAHFAGFTFAVLSVIHLAGGKIPEENLWQHMRKLGLDGSEEHHPIFGNVSSALDTLVQQRYLQKERVNGPEGNCVMYELAERALDESIAQRLKGCIAKVTRNDAAYVKPEESS